MAATELRRFFFLVALAFYRQLAETLRNPTEAWIPLTQCHTHFSPRPFCPLYSAISTPHTLTPFGALPFQGTFIIVADLRLFCSALLVRTAAFHSRARSFHTLGSIRGAFS